MTSDVVLMSAPICTVEVTASNISIDLSLSSIGIQGPQGPQGPTGPQGPQGPQGPSGSNDIGGYPVIVSNISPFDFLEFNGTVWNNSKKDYIIDGGNF